MKPETQSQMDTLIRDACHEVEREGRSASDRSVQLAAFHWLAERLSPQRNNGPSNAGRTQRGLRLVQQGGPWAILVGLILYLVERGVVR